MIELAKEPHKHIGVRHNPIVGPMPGTPNWEKSQRAHITAACMPGILNQSRWSDPAREYHQLVGDLKSEPDSALIRRRMHMESLTLAEYSHELGVTVITPLPLYEHPRHRFLGFLIATPDGERLEDKRLVQAKYIGSPQLIDELGEKYFDWLPEEWFIECQGTLEVCGDNEMDLVAWVLATLHVFTVVREPTVCEYIIKAAKEMAERVANRDPPEPNWAIPGAQEFVKALYPGIDHRQIVQLDKAATKAWKRDRELKRQRTAIDGEREAIRSKLLYEMGEAEYARLPGYEKILHRQQRQRKEHLVKALSFTVLEERKPNP